MRGRPSGTQTGSKVFPPPTLPEALVGDLRRMNPWWVGGALPVLPATRRHLVDQIHRRLALHLAPAVVVRGPRFPGGDRQRAWHVPGDSVAARG
jgi:hypothetical protein